MRKAPPVIQLALLGAGRIGQTHARAIAANPDARIAAIHDPDAEAARRAAPDARPATIAELAADPAIDGVLICTPTDTHADLIEVFARAGKAIFCEKPVDLDVARVRACLRVVQDQGATLMIGFNRRFDPHFRAARAAIDQGRIGSVEQVIITSRDPGLPPLDYLPKSGGIFRDMTIHDFDMARFMLGEEIASVMATASVLVDPAVGALGDYDTVSVILTTPSGRQAVISNSRRATYGYDQRVEVHGSLGAVTASNEQPVMVELADAHGYRRGPLHDSFMTRYQAAYAAEIAAFVALIRDPSLPHPGGADGLAALILAEAALESVRSGRRVDVGAGDAPGAGAGQG